MLVTPIVAKPDLAQFSPREQAVLRWLDQWIRKGTMLSHTANNRTYHWVQYAKAFQDLHNHFPSERQLTRVLIGLSGARRVRNDGQDIVRQQDTSPLERLQVYTKQGLRCYYRFRTEAPMKKLIESDGPKRHRNEVLQSRKLTPQVMEILEWALTLPRKGETVPLFTNHWAGDAYHYTQAIRQAAEYLHQLHEGTFLRNKKMGDWFAKAQSVDFEDVRPVLESVKGSWPAVFEMVKTAVRNFRFAYESDRLPINKQHLPKSVTSFLWNETGAGAVSYFLACVLNKPDHAKELMADQVYDSLPAEIVQIATPLIERHPDWNALEYWKAIRGVAEWGAAFLKANPRADGVRYWFGTGVISWFREYMQFLDERTDHQIKRSNLGIGNPTWNWYLGVKVEEHQIDPYLVYGRGDK